VGTIYRGESSRIRTVYGETDQYKVYDKNDDRVARLEFSTNGLTEEHLLIILSDRFKNKEGKENTFVKDCIDSALLAVSAGKITKVPKFMANHGYAELHVDLNSATKLYNVIVPAVGEEVKDLIPINTLHATIMYDKRNPNIIPSYSNQAFKAQIKEVRMMGKVGSKWRACALILESEGVLERHKQLVKEGFEHSYDDLLLHVSLVYGTEAEIAFPVIEKLLAEKKLPESITLCAETWDSIKD